MAASFNIPKEMNAILYNKIKDFSYVTRPVPSPKPHEALIKGEQFPFHFNKVAPTETHSLQVQDLQSKIFNS